ncbi:bromodomain adjacent to zinc finger domain protein 2B [Caerostris extrusa]|uniref:Bromodomain adjacent to zinc finger domain protein 2B n=1 Tax=Caerostris extrusa TaxID=172846 RepID=A0AAV4V890_CAEEX|nr:bromodomain adjacent to zinc finger domain protein 2B [Caerostris extrusa]
MDNAEQSPRPPSKGIFDTASLLAPSSTIFSSQSPTPVQSPLPHLAHSPSAFSVLGRNAVLIPPPSSNSDSTSPSGSTKMCSPIMHHSASDALSSLASSSVLNYAYTGPCSWWSAASPIGSSSEFPGCGGIPSPQTLKTNILPNIVGVSPKKLSKIKSSDKESNHSKIAERKQTKPHKEKKGKKSSSESDGHMESSSSTTGPDSAGAVSSSSSDSSDEEEREKQQKQLARLKRQQQELRRKVQELKQAS